MYDFSLRLQGNPMIYITKLTYQQLQQFEQEVESP